MLNAFANGQTDPIKSDLNIALRANILVSTAGRKSRPFTELAEYIGEGAVDGIVDPESKNSLNEWVSDGEKNTAFLRLTWTKEEKVKKVWLFDRPNLKDQVLSGLLVFSDGSTIKVSALPNDGRSYKEILFPEKKITWMSFIIDKVSPTTKNTGLAEIAVH